VGKIRRSAAHQSSFSEQPDSQILNAEAWEIRQTRPAIWRIFYAQA
jgi:hypothetical protein